MPSSVRADLDDFAAQLNALQTALEQERAALEGHQVAALETATVAKTAALEVLAEERFGNGLTERISAADPGEREKCEQLHTQCLDLARQLRDYNLVNGKILHRSHNSIREIINILSGKRAGGLYGQSGQPTADSQAGDSIAKA
ncbi:MAG: flagellar protein FlgN [Pseudomonadales bacterium]